MKNRKLRKLAAAAVVLAVLVMLFSGCAETPEPAPTEAPAALQQTAAPSPELPVVAPDEPAEWTVYWYMCGSNLESFYGCASSDLAEAMSVELPGSVRLVIETGGSYEWHNEQVSAGAIQRFVLDKNGMQLIEELPDANMGEKETLASFLSFCKDNYPSVHTMVLFWNHGGGSVAGAAFDEAHGYDSLTLREFADAFASVYPDTGTAPIDIVGFDTCLMSTVDVAETFRPYAKYMVASEELEPGCGWYYTGWLGALAEDPSSDAERVGRAICDTYAEECAARGCGYEITLALTDLGKLGELIESYNALGNEALISAISDPGFFALFGRSARVTENYGGNTREQGYTNMVDLGALVHNCESLFPGTAAAVLSAIDEAVIYRVNGEYRAEATGLSCYYSYNADLSDFADYTLVGASEAFKYLYAYGLTGQLSDAGMQYVSALGTVTAENKTAPTAYGGVCAGYLPLTADRPVSGRSYVSAMPYLGGAAASLLTVDYYYEPSLGVWIDPDTGSILPYDPNNVSVDPSSGGSGGLNDFWRQQQEMKEARQKAEEEARREAERLEAERLEAERLEAERLEAERQEAERKAREEQERLAAWQGYLAGQQALEGGESK